MAIGIGQAAGKIRKFFIADEMVSTRDAAWKGSGVYYHNSDQVPIKRFDEKDPPTMWFYEETLDGGIVAGSNQKIYGSDVRTPLDKILNMRRGRQIHIISGTHGAADGGNWARNSLDKIVHRNASLLDPGFFNADIRKYQDIKRGIFVQDIAKFNDEGLGYYLKQSSYDIILACCYSRNDSALRHFLNLKPVTSFVREKRYAKLQQDSHSPVFFP